jgi:hypothetical protein
VFNQSKKITTTNFLDMQIFLVIIKGLSIEMIWQTWFLQYSKLEKINCYKYITSKHLVLFCNFFLTLFLLFPSIKELCNYKNIAFG